MKPRLNASRDRLGLKSPGIENVEREFRTWSEYPEWLVFEGHRPFPVYGDDGSISCDVIWRVSRASKRGNEVYNWRVKKRMKQLYLLKTRPFTFSYFTRARGKKLSSAVFVTLTYTRELSLGDTWSCVGPDFNRWLSGIRRKFGSFEFIRCWEAQKDGYPHIHILMIFHDKEFKTFRYNRKWRIEEKPSFDWDWGFVDVQSMKNIGDGLDYIVKYIGKAHGLDKKGSRVTLALTWFYRKRSWSVSRAVNDLIRAMHNSNGITNDLSRDPEWIWSLRGFYGGTVVHQYNLRVFLDGEGVQGASEWSFEVNASEYFNIQSSVTWTEYKPRCRRWVDPVVDGCVLNMVF